MARISASAVVTRTPLFLVNWTAANAAQQAATGAPFVLKDGTTRADLQAKLDALIAEVGDINDKQQDRLVLVATRDALKTQTHDLMEMWRQGATYMVGGSPLVNALPTLPAMGEKMGDFVKTLDEAARRWTLINAAADVPHFTPPLVLRDGTTLAQFQTKIGALQSAATSLDTLEETLPIERDQRDNAAQAVYDLCKLYREGVLASFDPSSPVVQSLPTLNAPTTGHTPAPVELEIEYDAAKSLWVASWTASSDPDLAHYSFRLSPGPRYKGDDATELALLSPGVLRYEIPARFTPAGAELSGKLYVELSDTHEAGSNGVTINVPL